MKQKRMSLAFMIILSAAAAAVITGVTLLCIHLYNKRIHENFDRVATVYGQNGFTGEVYEFGIQSIEEIANQMEDLERVGGAEANAYRTYIIVQMDNGNRYHIKYASPTSVLVVKAETETNGTEFTYKKPAEYTTDGTLPQLCKALEIDHGLGFVME